MALAGVIEACRWLLELEARRTGAARALKPGEYRFTAGLSIDDALSKIVRHDVVARFVTIPEGLGLWARSAKRSIMPTGSAAIITAIADSGR